MFHDKYVRLNKCMLYFVRTNVLYMRFSYNYDRYALLTPNGSLLPSVETLGEGIDIVNNI